MGRRPPRPRPRRPGRPAPLRPAPLLLAALVAAGPALAHATLQESAQSGAAGPWYLYFDTTPTTVYSGKPFNATIYVTKTDYSRASGLAVHADWSGGAGADVGFREGIVGEYAAHLVTTSVGRQTLAFRIADPNATAPSEWNATVEVYRDLGVSVAAADASADYFANETKEFGVRVVNRSSGAPDPRVTDLRFRFEHWTDDHTTLLGSDVVEAQSRGGTWWAPYDWTGKGMYHIRAASRSLGMNFEDQPYVHVYAVTPLPPLDEERESPAGAWLAVAGVVAAAALAARRRR